MLSISIKRKSNRKKLLVLDYLYDQFLGLVLDKLKLGHEESLTLGFSSCRRGEGVSTVAFNTVLALTQSTRKNVLLVDANVRNPVLHKWFQIPPDQKGFLDVLKQEVTLGEALVKDTDEKFAILTAGTRTNHPIVLFDDKWFDRFLVEARKQFDIIVFDTPALLSGPETSVLASKLDEFILVIEAEKTRWEVAEYHKKQLVESGVRVSGGILNKKKMFIPRLIYKLLLAD